MFPYVVYALIDPRNGDIKYIGITTNPEERQRAHSSIFRPLSGNSKKVDWIEELRQAKLKPIFKPIDQADTNLEARAIERYWILYYRRWGINLLNQEILTNNKEILARIAQPKKRRKK